jgi:hypothetical protein
VTAYHRLWRQEHYLVSKGSREDQYAHRTQKTVLEVKTATRGRSAAKLSFLVESGPGPSPGMQGHVAQWAGNFEYIHP